MKSIGGFRRVSEKLTSGCLIERDAEKRPVPRALAVSARQLSVFARELSA
jgi:hypothetical protein